MSLRQRTASELLESRILEAALDLLDNQGFAAMTVRAIASKAHVAPMGIYNHFKSKNGVIETLLVQSFDELADVMRESRCEDLSCQVRIMSTNYRKFALDNPARYRLIFMESFGNFEPSLPIAEASAAALQSFIGLIEPFAHAGQLPDRPLIDLATSFWSVVHGFISLEVVDKNFAIDREGVFVQLVEDYWRGITTAK